MTNETENREPEHVADNVEAVEAVVEEEVAIEEAEASGENTRPRMTDEDLSGDDDGGDDGIVDADDEPAPAVLAGKPADAQQLQRIVEGALMAAGKPLAVSDLGDLFEPADRPASDEIRAALAAIAEQSVGRGFELREIASGFRFQVVQEVAPWVGRLWDEKPQRYSRALLETLALIAYRQPITRGDIEDIRGVAVASNIVKTLLERDWVRVVGHKDVPGRPAMYATTRKFLDYFNLKNLDELPPLAELRDLDSLNAELALEGADTIIEESAAVESNVVSITGDASGGDAVAADHDAETPPASAVDDEEAAEQPAQVTLASLAAGFAEREVEEEAQPDDEQPVAEKAEAGAGSDFASLVAALRARDQNPEPDAATVDTATVDKATGPESDVVASEDGAPVADEDAEDDEFTPRGDQ